ncbi:hypothetical protein BT96DRAFT_84259 [Gymnopus androsaceus JB14]|uniref:F-box domain-containing protein n=1 Tax=Gymnopus androsaceus JB14 TaxID=1447944 RepID=A0A6A4IDH6_9AGAR|nr:hypothetical protein BT96DRAFT_84259 [Gymnopus androsaceus JB14]
MSLQPQTRLTSLPNELLEIICSFVPVWSIFPGKRRSIYAVSARTNRQLRSFALAFLFSKISAKLSKLRERTKFVEDAAYLDAVRCLRLGSRDFSRAMPIGDFSPVQDLPELPGLQELISMDHPLDYPTLHSLAMKSKYQSRLQHLSLSWNDDRLPDIQEWFPQLKTLCLSLYEPVHLDFPVSAPNITSLAVCHHRLSSEICASFRSCFPNLRSPALYQTSTEITELFSIIETTPSLCEVTYRPSTAEIILLGHLIPVIVGDSSFRIEDLTVPPFHWPAHYSWRNVEFVDLAFVRKPVECSVDNSGPRYSLISLSLELRSETGEKDDLMEILSDFPSQPGLAHIEELCLAPVIYSDGPSDL